MLFGLPASEIAVHPAEAGGRHDIYVLVENVNAFIAAMRLKQVRTAPVRAMSWGDADGSEPSRWRQDRCLRAASPSTTGPRRQAMTALKRKKETCGSTEKHC